MPKNIPPQMGFMAADILEAEGPLYTEKIAQIAANIRRFINNDTCLTDSQSILIMSEMSELAKRISLSSSPLRRSEKNYYTREVVEGVHPIVQMINLFRLDCINCLNAECEHRDKKFPVSKVQKRVQ